MKELNSEIEMLPQPKHQSKMFLETIKKNEKLLFETTWMDLEGIIEYYQVFKTEKIKYCMISLICEI